MCEQSSSLIGRSAVSCLFRRRPFKSSVADANGRLVAGEGCAALDAGRHSLPAFGGLKVNRRFLILSPQRHFYDPHRWNQSEAFLLLSDCRHRRAYRSIVVVLFYQHCGDLSTEMHWVETPPCVSMSQLLNCSGCFSLK